MKKFFVLLIFLLISGSVMAQGSPGVVAPVYTKVGDTLVVIASTGDTVILYDSSSAVVQRIRGTATYWVFPNLFHVNDLEVQSSATIAGDATINTIIMDNGITNGAPIYSFTGNGLELVNGLLTATIGATVEGSEITNQTIGKSDIDTTIANMVFAALYKKTSAVSDSQFVTKYYVDHNLFGYIVTGTPSNGQVAVYDGGTGGWTFGAGGSGSGDDGVFDMTLDNSNYVLGATTYTGGYINTSTHWQRGDTGINLVKSGQHPGDTILHQIDWARVQRNDGTQSIRTFRTTTNDTLLVMQDSSTFTKMTTSNTSGWRFEAPMHITSNMYFSGNGRHIDSLGFINSRNRFLFIDSDSGIYMNAVATNSPVYFGSSTNWTLWSDTLKGTGNGFMYGIKRIISDTIVPTRIRQDAGSTFIVTSTDTTLKIVRDTANDTTTMTANGKLKFVADAGLTEMDSVALHGRLRMYDGTNKSRIDSASGISADTLKTLPGGFLTLQGATSGRTRIKGNGSAITSYDLVLPAAQGAANQALINDGSGNFSWGSAGTGNGSADIDSSTAGLDSNVWKGAGGTILLDVHKNSTPSVVIGKGATMTSLIIGGNNSGLSSIDTSVLIYNRLYFGATVNKQTMIDSTFVYDQLKGNRYYFRPDDFWGSPEAYAVRHTFTSWNESDTTGTFPNSMYKRSSLFYARDTNGVNVLPYNFTWIAPSRDSLFSTVYTVKSGFTDVDSSSLYAAALYVNETKVDTLNPQKASVAYTVDSLNWTDRAIAAGDVVTVLLYLKLNPTATSKKRVDFKELYLNMRRY